MGLLVGVQLVSLLRCIGLNLFSNSKFQTHSPVDCSRLVNLNIIFKFLS